MFLAADIGGTKAHLALYDQVGKYIPIKQKKFESKKYSSLEEILQEFLEDKNSNIEKACFGIAGPIREGKCETPNLPWIVETRKLQKVLGTQKIELINDLIANSYGIEVLSEKDYFVVNAGSKIEGGNQAILSPGTGLGEAGRVFDGKKYIPFASEGGHCDFLVRNEEELGLFQYLKQRFTAHVSIERALSGPGLENIYHYLIQAKGMQPLHGQTVEKGSLAKVISEEGLKKSCPVCQKALEIFIDIYGAEAGNLALKFFAVGGFFIGGGIAPKILQEFKNPRFMNAFSSKGRMEHILRSIPIKIILNEETALLGAAYFASHIM